MVDPGFLDRLEQIARILRKNESPFGGIQVIFCGDFMQLPPVVKGSVDRRFAFEAECWNSLVGSRNMLLTRIFRQRDAKLVTVLREIRGCCLSSASEKLLRATEHNQLNDAPML